jgi:hypothetical protein
MKINIVTVANKIEGYLKIYKKTCKKNNIQLNILGFNEKWQGYIWRMEKIINYLKNLNENDIIVISDGFDVILCATEKELYEKYLKFNKDIIIGIDELYGIKKSLAKRIWNDYNGYQICAGLIIGNVKSLQNMYNLMKKQFDLSKFNDDQLLLTLFLNKNPDFVEKYIAIDTKSQLFLNLSFSKLYSYFDNTNELNKKVELIKNNRILYKKYNTKPVFLHGPASLNLKKYIKHLGYNNIPDIKSLSIKRVIYYLKLLLKNLKMTDYIIILLVLAVITRILN